MGWVTEEEKAKLLSECRMIVIPSVLEAYGLVAAEAMSYGKAVIASNTGGLPEVVGNAGLMVPPQDEKALSDAILKLDKDDDLRMELGGKPNAGCDRSPGTRWPSGPSTPTRTSSTVDDRHRDAIQLACDHLCIIHGEVQHMTSVG